MADTNIETYLNKIIKSVYGRDVRDAIYKAIEQCYSDVTSPTLNESSFRSQIEYKFQELIDDGTLVNLAIEDGSITSEKLASDIFSVIPLGVDAYEQEVVVDVADLSQLKIGSFVNNVPVVDRNGNTYFTDYIDFSAGDIRIVLTNKNPYSNSVVRVYDADKNYLGQKYLGFHTTTTNNIISDLKTEMLKVNVNGVYAVWEYNPVYVECLLVRPRLISTKRLALTGAEFSSLSVGTGSFKMEITTNDAWCDFMSVLPNTEYELKSLNNVSQTIHFYDACKFEIGSWYFEKNNGIQQTFTTPDKTAYVRAGGGNQFSIIITGNMLIDKQIAPNLNLVPANVNTEFLQAVSEGLGITVGKDVNETYYNCTKYGVLPASPDNTEAFQALIDMIHENGGGTIWIPNGTYYFKSDVSSWAMTSNITCLCEMKSGVSIHGESMNGTILKVTGETPQGSSLFAQNSGYSKNVLVGCKAENFTVDMSEASLKSYTHKGKAFYYSGIKDCVFRDLKLLETPSTSLGIDMLDNVVMDSIYVYKGGRQWVFGGNGGAGIGIGTGKWSEENYIIRNCVCDACGHFGIFLEDQGVFSATKDKNYSKGQIITNNVVRNGRHYGIGVRGGKNVLVSGNNIYDCKGGLYTDYGAKNVVFSNNLVQGSTEAGFNFGNEDKSYPCENIAVVGNTFFENAVGIKSTIEPTNSQKMNNVFIGNTTDEV